VKTFADDGTLLYHGSILDGKQIGYSISLHANGKKAKVGVSETNGYMKGMGNFGVEYWDNGQIRMIGNKKLERDGKFPQIASYTMEHMDREDRDRMRKESQASS
jgi:hypothetical protein